MKILVVDDSPAIRVILSRYLRELGHDIIGEASNGFEAIEQYAKLKPDLVTMDIVMPECDGVHALIEIIKRDANALIVMITSAATVSNMFEAKEAGAVGFVIKPFVLEKVSEVIEDIQKIISERAA